MCPSCGFTSYAQSAPAVAAFVVEDGRTLLALRAHEPDAGRWDLLGGFLDEGEDPLDGLRRELLEETGLEIEPGDYLGAYVDSYGENGHRPSSISSSRPASSPARWRRRTTSPSCGGSTSRRLPPTDELAFSWVARFLADVTRP